MAVRTINSAGNFFADRRLVVVAFPSACRRQPFEPVREIPVPVAEQLHRGGQEDAPDDCGVDEDGGSEPDARLFELEFARGGG